VSGSECACEVAGSLNNEAECSRETGMCTCKENVHGQNCDECVYTDSTVRAKLGNESVPIQLAQCQFPGLAISNAKNIVFK